MTRLIASELVKLRTTQVAFWLLVANAALAALTVVGPLASGQGRTSQEAPDLFSAAASAYVVVFVLGVLVLTTEFRYQTITPTLLATPRRARVVLAKGVTMLLVGVVFSLVTVLVQMAVVLPWLAARGVSVDATGPDGVVVPLVKAFVVVLLYGLLGFGFGALARNQVVGVVVGLVYVIVVENLVLAIPGVKHVYPYLPGGAATAISAGGETINGVTLLPTAAGVVLLAAWTVVLVALGLSTSLRRDVT